MLQPGSLVVYANSITKTEQSRKQSGDEGYAREELVAELASAFLCAELGITPEVMPDHASYIANWLTVLKNDKRAIFSAAAHAQKAAEYLHGPEDQLRGRSRVSGRQPTLLRRQCSRVRRFFAPIQ